MRKIIVAVLFLLSIQPCRAQTHDSFDQQSGPFYISIDIDHTSDGMIIQGIAVYSSDHGMVEVLKIPRTMINSRKPTLFISDNQNGYVHKALTISEFTWKHKTRDQNYICDRYNLDIDFEQVSKNLPNIGPRKIYPEDLSFVEEMSGLKIQMTGTDFTCEEDFNCGLLFYQGRLKKVYVGLDAGKPSGRVIQTYTIRTFAQSP